jgi:hypothetical protein
MGTRNGRQSRRGYAGDAKVEDKIDWGKIPDKRGEGDPRGIL